MTEAPNECLIRSLGYIGLVSARLDAWPVFGGDLLGMEVLGDVGAGALRLRMDEKQQRYFIRAGKASGIDFLGFEVEGAADLARLAVTLEQGGHVVHEGTAQECALRSVDGMLWVRDPDQHRIEFYHHLHDATTPLAPGKPIGGFRTDNLGMGHAVLYTPNYAAMSAFYQSLLRFRLTDFHHEPFAIDFLRVNPRHHTLALISDAGGLPRIHHLMLEYRYWDDVGRAYDIALANPESIAVTLGRHYNDHMTSFYVWSPDNFFVEVGWAGRTIDNDATWVPQEVPAPSLWGHIRYWQNEEKREQTRKMIAAIGAKGIRAPVSAWDDGPFTPKKSKARVRGSSS